MFVFSCMLLLILLLPAYSANASRNALNDISFSAEGGERTRFVLSFASPPPVPSAYSIHDPPMITLDFPATDNRLKPRNRKVGIGVTKNIRSAQAKGRTRVVLDLTRLQTYQSEVIGNDLILILDSGNTVAPLPAATRKHNPQRLKHVSAPQLTNIDFRRGLDGEGLVLITLSEPDIAVDVRKQDAAIVLHISNAELRPKLKRKLDVTDFATPVKHIDTFEQNGQIWIVIRVEGDYEQLSYQSDNLYTVEIKKVPETAQKRLGKKEFTGEKLSLNFDGIETRKVLQLIADFKDLNLILSDSVSGRLTLRLKDVPWDQALDIILKTKGLGMRKTGNVLFIATRQEIAAQKKLDLQEQKQAHDLGPLHSELIQINYANAKDLAVLLKAKENSLLSDRGSVTVDTRTNTLLVKDIPENLQEIRYIVKRLDVPVRQVLIESRIVVASDNFSKELGVRFGVTNINDGSGGSGLNSDFVTGNLGGVSDVLSGDQIDINDTLNVNLPVSSPAGSIGLALAKLPLGTLLELELSAAQVESRVEVISTPRVITSNKGKARIERGVNVPYQESSSSGATSTSFQKAVLSLEVTPQITPDDHIFMDLAVNNDSVGDVFDSVPSINTQAIQTQVLVDNGQTVVLGGIYDQNTTRDTTRVPFFSDIPILGRLFRNDSQQNDRGELLIFITPKIIAGSKLK